MLGDEKRPLSEILRSIGSALGDRRGSGGGNTNATEYFTITRHSSKNSTSQKKKCNCLGKTVSSVRSTSKRTS